MSRKEDALKRLACVLGCVDSEEDVNGNTVDEIIDCIVQHLPAMSGGAKYYTVTIPTADTAEGWQGSDESGYKRNITTPYDETVAVIPTCDDNSIFTECGLTIYYDEQYKQWAVSVKAYPSKAATLNLLFISATNGGAL